MGARVAQGWRALVPELPQRVAGNAKALIPAQCIWKGVAAARVTALFQESTTSTTSQIRDLDLSRRLRSHCLRGGEVVALLAAVRART
jgi:hypothetical protein